MSDRLVVLDPVQVTVATRDGTDRTVDVPAGPLGDGLPLDVIRHLVEAGRAVPESSLPPVTLTVPEED